MSTTKPIISKNHPTKLSAYWPRAANCNGSAPTVAKCLTTQLKCCTLCWTGSRPGSRKQNCALSCRSAICTTSTSSSWTSQPSAYLSKSPSSLKRGNKTFQELFSYNDPEGTPILIVTLASLHQYEKGVVGFPNRPQFTQLMLLYQEGP